MGITRKVVALGCIVFVTDMPSKMIAPLRLPLLNVRGVLLLAAELVVEMASMSLCGSSSYRDMSSRVSSRHRPFTLGYTLSHLTKPLQVT